MIELVMYEKYGMSLMKPFLDRIIKTNECGTIVALPEAGVNRTLYAYFESEGLNEKVYPSSPSLLV